MINFCTVIKKVSSVHLFRCLICTIVIVNDAYVGRNALIEFEIVVFCLDRLTHIVSSVGLYLLLLKELHVHGNTLFNLNLSHWTAEAIAMLLLVLQCRGHLLCL